MQFLCLSLRVIDRPRRTRRTVRASSKISSEHSTASACPSRSNSLSSGRMCNSERRPAAAAAVQVRSHAGWGLFHGNMSTKVRVRDTEKPSIQTTSVVFSSPQFMHHRGSQHRQWDTRYVFLPPYCSPPLLQTTDIRTQVHLVIVACFSASLIQRNFHRKFGGLDP
jgi:hypothetical protein